MPGWRLGWIIVPELQVENLLKLSQNIFISSGNIAQFLAVKAFDCIKDLDKIVEGYRYNRDQSLKILNKMPLLNFSIPQGAFYFYINIEKLNIDSFSLVDRLLMETGVALTPGVDFDKLNGKKTIRISFSSETKNVLNGMKIFRKWYQKYY